MCAVLAGGPGAVWAAGRDWTGSARCGSCHPAELAAWRATAHAKSFASAQRVAERVCLGCHTTGESPAGPVIEDVVGCEACHGAGADYAADDLMRNRRLAHDLGLIDLSTPAKRAAVCAACHGVITARPGFDPARLLAPAHPRARPSSSPSSSSSPPSPSSSAEASR